VSNPRWSSDHSILDRLSVGDTPSSEDNRSPDHRAVPDATAGLEIDLRSDLAAVTYQDAVIDAQRFESASGTSGATSLAARGSCSDTHARYSRKSANTKGRRPQRIS